MMGADRVDMVEGLVEDVAHGKIPNILRAMGVPAEWKHNKEALVKTVAVAAAIGAMLFALTRWSRDENQ